MLPVSCPTNAIVYKASGKFLYIPCINILKRYRLEMFFTLLAKLSGISEYLNVLIWSNVCKWSFVCRDEVLANAHSWHRHEYCYPCGKVKSKIIKIACCSIFLPFVCWSTFFDFKFIFLNFIFFIIFHFEFSWNFLMFINILPNS